MWKWILALVLALSGIAAPPAAAADSIDISVHVPLNGLVKYDQWTRLNVTLTNNGAPFSGSVSIYQDRSRYREEDRDLGIRQEVSLTPGETKQYDFDLSGEMFNQSLVVKVLDGEMEVASYPVASASPKDERVVAVVSDDPNAFHFLLMNKDKSMATNQTSFLVQNVDPTAIPDQSWVLKNVDMLAIGGSTSTIAEEQIAAIKEWVHRGGVLLLSAGPGQDETVQPFSDLLSVPAGSPGELQDLGELQEVAGDDPLPITSLPVYHQGSPLIVPKQLGAGLLLFANYDVTAEPLASWQHNREWWQHVLTKHGAIERINQHKGLFDHTGSQLSRIIPGVRTPDAGWLFFIWFLYILVVAPLVYIWLKRIDRREWAWGIIPGLAILLSIGIFTIGRTLVVDENTSYTVSRIEIIDETAAEVSSTGTFLQISGGTYTVEAKPNFVVNPYGRYVDERTDVKASIYRQQGQNTRITLEQVPYLTIRQIAAAGLKEDVGAFSTALTVEGKRLLGTVKNNTSFDIEQLYVDLGMQRIPLGPLEKGEEMRVDKQIEEYVIGEIDDKAYYPEPPSREERMEMIRQDFLDTNRRDKIRLVGSSSQPLQLFTMQGEHEAHHYSMVSQEVQLTPNQDGRIVYPYGTLPVRLENEEGKFFSRSSYAYELADGSATFALAAGEADIDVKRLEVPLDLNPYRPFVKEIYHAKSNTWKPLGREERVVLEEQLPEYLNRDGNLLIRFRNPTSQPLTLPEPLFQVEGEER
ncbi:hypothetical protein LOK74_07280 [Brevibacillus humidisoli]|uniref:hypothetical protein n=1 Tax=Brevibacillus humidisoli TaxID=2895522 RepID=UPI001E590D33|nr:hypothetical protein [Brevibacillus humidisoli]UFJ42285.1 hypothetical protein LOK74_07280 [Brevibacillus humidisoli]